MALTLLDGFKRDGETGGTPTTPAADLVAHIRRELDGMARFRTSIGFDQRLIDCLRLREGRYSPSQVQEIQRFGGTQVFARLTTNKIRGAAARLRSIFIQKERPWEIKPTPVPTLPVDIRQSVTQLVQLESQTLAQAGQPPDAGMVKQRFEQLLRAAQDAARRQATEEAVEATRFIDDLLVEGGFYNALDEFLLDFCTFPMAVLRGPTAVMASDVRYVEGTPQVERRPQLRYERVDPFDFLWSAGARRVEEASVIERLRMTRGDLNSLLGLPGYDEDAIRSVLRDYGERGHAETAFVDSARNDLTNQEDEQWTNLLDVLAFSGTLCGREIEELGIEDALNSQAGVGDQPAPSDALDPDLDYLVQAWLCGEYLLKVQVDPDPRARIPYYVAAYEPVAGSIPGTALPELMSDVQETCNATLRALVNNLSISSGPQVVVNEDVLADPQDVDELFPWKRWRTTTDPAVSSRPPVEFFQPTSNAIELTQVFQFFSNLADEISAIPRYLTGNERIGGAGRTASGLSMLMQNASGTITSVAAGVDNHVLTPLLQKTYDLVLLTTGNQVLRGDEQIVVKGATHAETRETDRMRLLEFLQFTGQSPFDMQIIGLPGRAVILKKIADSLGLDGEKIVPSPDELQARLKAQMQEQQQQADLAAQQGPSSAGQVPKPAAEKTRPNQLAEETDNLHRARGPGRPAPALNRPGRPR
jgi:hypothetical protein